jgi:hypothetical protein
MTTKTAKTHSCGVCDRCRRRLELKTDLDLLKMKRDQLNAEEAEIIEKLARQKCKPTGSTTEKLLRRATAFLKGTSRDRVKALKIHHELVEALPNFDLFWPTWRFGISRKGL